MLNGPAIVNGGDNVYDRAICFDAPVEFDTGLYAQGERTLQDLRNSLMRRLGFAAMIANPLPDMVALLNEFLQDAQSQLYWRYDPLRTERWWGIQTTPGKRIYDVPIDCTKALNFRKIRWAGVADSGGIHFKKWAQNTAFALNDYVLPLSNTGLVYRVTVAGTTPVGAEPAWPSAVGQTVTNGPVTFVAADFPQAQWYPLVQGIDPTEYTILPTSQRPQKFELREYLEIFPAPDTYYTIWIRGHMGLTRFTQDADKATIDSDLLFLLALANAKAHYSQPDARAIGQQCELMLRKLNAGTFGVKKYVPGDKRPAVVPRPRIV